MAPPIVLPMYGEPMKIWSVNEGRYIEVPPQRRELLKVYVDLYLFESAVKFLFNGTIRPFTGRSDDGGLWERNFSPIQTRYLVEAQRRIILRGVEEGIKQCWDEWKQREGFPKYPTTASECGAAGHVAHMIQRHATLLSVLGPRNETSDSYLQKILSFFENVVSDNGYTGLVLPTRMAFSLAQTLILPEAFSNGKG